MWSWHESFNEFDEYENERAICQSVDNQGAVRVFDKCVDSGNEYELREYPTEAKECPEIGVSSHSLSPGSGKLSMRSSVFW